MSCKPIHAAKNIAVGKSVFTVRQMFMYCFFAIERRISVDSVYFCELHAPFPNISSFHILKEIDGSGRFDKKVPRNFIAVGETFSLKNNIFLRKANNNIKYSLTQKLLSAS
jgi:hypothetical protein